MGRSDEFMRQFSLYKDRSSLPSLRHHILKFDKKFSPSKEDFMDRIANIVEKEFTMGVEEMVEIRQLREIDREDAILLADKTFRDKDHISMGEAFPYIFDGAHITHSFGAWEDGQLVSFMGLVPAKIRIHEAVVSVYSLGSVCTDEAHRGKGYASLLMEKVLQFIRNTDASLLLVSGDRGLYQRADCYPFGSVTKFNITSGTIESHEDDHPYEVREMVAADLLTVSAIASRREVAYEQSTSELSTLIHAGAFASCMKMEHKTLVATRNEKVTAFLVLGVGSGKAISIEWGGDIVALLPMLQEAFSRFDLAELEFTVPWHEHGVQTIFGKFDSQPMHNEGTIHLVDAERFYEQLKPFLEQQLPQFTDGISVSNLKNGKIGVAFLGRTLEFTPKELVSFLFDTDQSGNFPIPFPYTAGLNFV